jgi:hypothetical protein
MLNFSVKFGVCFDDLNGLVFPSKRRFIGKQLQIENSGSLQLVKKVTKILQEGLYAKEE